MDSIKVEINLGAIKGNIAHLADQSRKGIMAVVKANAYGHGAVPVSKAALQAGASWLAVSRAEEAFELRHAGISSPILLFGCPPDESLPQLIDKEISLSVWDLEYVSRVSAVAHRLQKKVHVHLKVDTGMGRLGILPQSAAELAQKFVGVESIDFQGMFTHFACADESDLSSVKSQELNFKRVIDDLQSMGIRPPFIHAANSAATLVRQLDEYDLVRPGIAMYGLHPSAECKLPPVFQPALRWTTVLIQVKILPSKHGVGYGHIYHTDREERIGIIAAGYADGFRRVTGNQVLIRGKRVPVVGRVSMDLSAVQLDDLLEARVGDEVLIIGSQDGEVITAEEVAERWGTINYEVVCGIGARIPRYYL